MRDHHVRIALQCVEILRLDPLPASAGDSSVRCLTDCSVMEGVSCAEVTGSSLTMACPALRESQIPKKIRGATGTPRQHIGGLARPALAPFESVTSLAGNS